MKKVLALILLFSLVIGVFAGCKGATVAPIEKEPSATEAPAETTAPQQVVDGPVAQDAIDALVADYPDNGEETPVDYTRYAKKRLGSVVFDVVWTVGFETEVENPDDFVKITINAAGDTALIDINEECEEDIPYTLTATITDSYGNVASFTWNYILPKAEDMVAIVHEAYALQPGEVMDREVRLRGKIISLDTVYEETYDNITVTIEIEGAEGMPIKCYRMTSTADTHDYIPNLLVGNIITVKGTIKNYNGVIEFDTGCKLLSYEVGDATSVPTDPGVILREAYALGDLETLPYPVTLTGKVTAINAPYDPNYKNISVTFKVEGYEQYPVLCYRMKGMEAELIAIDDIVTVTGIIKMYRGTVEFDTGCQLLERISGGRVAEGPSSDPVKILADAAKLQVGESLPYRATLTGEIVSLDKAYDPEFGSVTVTIKVNGVKLQCYRMEGDGVNLIRETDTITVSGIIKNYNGKLEFDSKCTLDSWTMGPRPVGYGPLSENTAYKLYLPQTALGKNLYFNGKVSGNKLSTSEDSAEAIDVYLERVSGQGVRFYYMDGTVKTYLGIEEYTNSDGKIRGRVFTSTSNGSIYKYVSDLGLYAVNLPTAGKYFMGTYSTYNTISASWCGYIDGTMNSPGQIIAKFCLPDQLPEDPEAPEGPEEPDVDTLSIKEAIDLGLSMTHNSYTNNKYYVTGVITEIYNTSYGNMYITDGNGNTLTIYGTYDATGTNRFDAMANKPKAGDTITVYGSVGQYNGTAQIKNGWITSIEGSGNPDTPVVPPVQDADVVTDPQIGVTYKFGIDQKALTKIIYFNGTMSGFYGATSEKMADGVDVALEAADGGYYLTFTDASGAKKYINAVVSGTHKNFTIADSPVSVYTWSEEYNTLLTDLEGTTCYIGTYGTYNTFSVSPIDKISTSYPAHFYIPGEGGDVEPDVTEPTTTEPGVSDGSYVKVTSAEQFTSGQYVLLVSTGYAPGEFLATGTNGWLTAVQPVVSGNTVTNSAGGVWTLTVSGNTVKITDANGVSVAPKGGNANGILSGDYDWTWSFNNGTFRFVGNGSDTVTLASNANEDPTYGGFHKFRAYKNATVSGSPDVYPCDFTLYKLDGEYVEPDVTEPTTTEPEATEPSIPADNTLTVKEAIDLGSSMSHNTYTSDKYYVTGKITEIYNTTYGNMKITDDNGNILTIYGTYDATGANRFDAMTNQPAVGDTITVYGPVGQYNGTAQIKNGWITSINGSDTPDTPVVPPVQNANMVTSPEIGVVYKWGIEQINLSKTLYFAGTMDTYYGATTENIANAVDVMLEAADGGYHVTFTDAGGAKKYINLVISGTHKNFTIADSAVTVYTWSEEYNTLLTDLEGTTCYIGTFGTYNTFSVSTLDKISTSYPAHFYIPGEGGDVEPDVTEPVVTEPTTTEPTTTEPVVPGEGYVKVTSASQFTSGEYVMIVATGYAPGEFLATGSNGWLTAVQPVVSGNVVTDTAGGVWTLTVSGNTVKITDANGVTVTPKGGNSNGILSGDYDWTWSFSDGTFRFTGNGSDTVTLASNANEDPTYGGFHKFRGYKNNTVSGSPDVYYCDFTLFKLNGEYVEPEVTEPTVTEPAVTEPSTPSDNTLTVKEAIDLGASMAHNTYTSDKYYVTGKITEIYNTTYGNMKITDDNGNILTIYGTYDATGANRFDAMSNQPAVGDTITVYGPVGQYNGTAQIKNGWITSIEGSDTPDTPVVPPVQDADVVTNPEIGVAYKWGIAQNNLGKTIYFAGTMDTYYGATTENIANAVDVMLEAADGGYHVTFTNASGAKKYINLVISGTHKNFTIADSAVTVYTWSEEYNTLLTDLEGTTCYIGTFGTYNTFSVSTLDKISTSYPAHFYVIGEGGETPDEPIVTEPEGVTYNIVAGANLTIDLEKSGELETVSFEYMLTDGTFNIALMMPNGNEFYGYFAFDVYGNVDRYDGVTVETLSGGYFRVTLDVSALTKMTGSPDASASKLYIRGLWTDGTGIIRNVKCVEKNVGTQVSIDFSTYAKGEQYVEQTYTLHDMIELYMVGCSMNVQLRIYQDAKGDGQAVFTCTNVIKSVTINAGNKDSGLEVYASVDGVDWVLIETLSVVAANADYTVDMPEGTSYKYLKLDSVAAQIRIPYMNFIFG